MAVDKNDNSVAYSRVMRGMALFRAPEIYANHSGANLFPKIGNRNILSSKYYAYSRASDIWSLGIAFLSILTESNVFRIERDRPFMSHMGSKRIIALEASGAPLEEIQSRIIIECVRWQTYRLFGSSDTGGGSGATSVSMRALNIGVMLGGSVKRGLIGDNDAQAFTILLTKMLSPIPSQRCSAGDVFNDPAFYRLAGWTSKLLGSITLDAVDPAVRPKYRPRCGWTLAKDAAVTLAMREAFLNSKAVLHLPAEALFVAYDVAARVVSGIDTPEPPELSAAAAAAGIRVALMLYDAAQSFSMVDTISSENEATRMMEPYVVEYLKGNIRRDEALYAHIRGEPSATKSAVMLLLGDSASSRAFREAYFYVDMVTFISSVFGITSSYITNDGSLRPEHVTVYDLLSETFLED